MALRTGKGTSDFRDEISRRPGSEYWENEEQKQGNPKCYNYCTLHPHDTRNERGTSQEHLYGM